MFLAVKFKMSCFFLVIFFSIFFPDVSQVSPDFPQSTVPVVPNQHGFEALRDATFKMELNFPQPKVTTPTAPEGAVKKEHQGRRGDPGLGF
jgi:hypothetical protein